MSHKVVLIMAGGTGGHVYPALAVADYLQQHDIAVYWLGTLNGLEYRVVPEKGYELIPIGISGLRGKGISKWLLAPFMIMLAIIQAIFIIKRIKPDAVLGMGGFVSGPGGIAAWLLRVPLYIHEQNSILGLTNRLLVPFAIIVMEGFPNTFKSRGCVRTTGNPVREKLISLPEPEQRLLNKNDNCIHLLVIGGSLGAKILNEKLPATLRYLEGNINIDIWHQTGNRNFSETKKNYASIQESFRIRIDPFIEDMAEAYAWADIVLCRAGALTIAELCAVGIASILVPYPYAVDDHQTVNAKFLSDRGCAILLPEAELEEKKLAEILIEFSDVRDKLLEMAKLARQLAKPNATQEVGDICMGAMYA